MVENELKEVGNLMDRIESFHGKREALQ